MLVVDDDGEGLDWEVFSKTEHARKVLDDEGNVVVRVGASRMSLLGKDLYLWMVPGPGLAPVRARELRRLWREALGDRTVIVLVNRKAKKAARWAKFFGFTYARPYGEDDVYVICGSGS